jgi:hypothetical protein
MRHKWRRELTLIFMQGCSKTSSFGQHLIRENERPFAGPILLFRLTLNKKIIGTVRRFPPATAGRPRRGRTIGVGPKATLIYSIQDNQPCEAKLRQLRLSEAAVPKAAFCGC